MSTPLTRRISCLTTMLVAALLHASAARAQQAFFTGLGDLPGGRFRSEATDISADGSIIVGRAWMGTDLGDAQGFRWTRDAGMVSLDPTLLGYRNYRVSADGSTVINGDHRWTQETGFEPLDALPEYDFTSASDLTADGTLIVGMAGGAFANTGVRWTTSGVEKLPFDDSRLFAVSGDGLMLGGYQIGPTIATSKGFLWTQNSGVIELALDDEWGGVPIPSAINNDGSIVIGFKSFNVVGGPFKWTSQTGAVRLMWETGELFGGAARGVSEDGSVIVGSRGSEGAGFTNGASWIWDSTNGARDLKTLLIDEFGLGQTLAGWGTLKTAMGVSADGRTITGWGVNPDGENEAYIAYLGTPVPGDYNGDGAIGPADYNIWRSTFGSMMDLRADGNFDGIVDAADYTVWRNALGAGAAPDAGSLAQIPEPTAADLATAGLILCGLAIRRRR